MSVWTNEQIEFLKKHYAMKGARWCGEKLNKTPVAVSIKARRYGITRDGDARYNREPAPVGYSNCFGCNQILPDSCFYKKTSEGKYGKKTNFCIECSRTKARHYFTNSGKYKWNKNREANPIHFIYIRLKGSAKKRGIYFNLTEQDLRDKWNTHCPIYKKELVFFSNSDWSPSIDRINNQIGYTRENIVVVSRKANQQKNSTNLEELKMLYDYYSSINTKT